MLTKTQSILRPLLVVQQLSKIYYSTFEKEKRALNSVDFLSTAGMMLFGCLVATPYQVTCFIVGIFSLRRRLDGYHAKTPLRCLFLSIGASIFCLSIVKNLIQYSLSILIWILFISLSSLFSIPLLIALQTARLLLMNLLLPR